MNANDAQYFAGLCEDWINIPAFVCEVIESKLVNGEYLDVLEYIVQRHKEINGQKDI